MSFRYVDRQLSNWLIFSFMILAGWGSCISVGQEGRSAAPSDRFAEVRREMVRLCVENAGVRNPRVLETMRNTLRHEFVPENLWDNAYLDGAVPIGNEQTISSPYIVAFMTEALEPKETDKVLEIGTGSGYQAAVLSPLVADVYTIEIVEPLGKRAEQTLKRLGYDNVHCKIGDGFLGWPEAAPFDKIIVTCSPEKVPEPLIEQLVDGGMMVIPVGERYQQTLTLLKKVDGKLVEASLQPTYFVPMTGTAEDKREVFPDGSSPEVVNGDFEEGLDENNFVKGWYYERLLTFVEPDESDTDRTVRDSRHIRFDNDKPGQVAHLMQGIAIDGRKVSQVEYSGRVKYENVKKGPGEYDWPYFSIAFYDSQRREIGRDFFGPFKDTHRGWRKLSRRVPVPVGTTNAMVRIGMFGATGTVYFDDLAVKKTKSAR